MSTERDALLARVIDDVARQGLSDRSLRELARATGTSHRMLLYHFGSREGLVTEIVAAVEASQRTMLRELATTVDGPAELIRALWRRVSAEQLRPFLRLFFESLVYTSRGQAGDRITAPWLTDSEAVAAQLGVAYDEVDIRLGIAVVRGLLIDVLATGETAAATASLERFLERYTPSPSGAVAEPHKPSPLRSSTPRAGRR